MRVTAVMISVLAMLLGVMPAAGAQAPEVTRLAGATRYETAAAIAQRQLDQRGTAGVIVDIVQDTSYHLPLVVSSWSAAAANARPSAILLLLPADATIPPASSAVLDRVAADGSFTIAGDGAFVGRIGQELDARTGGRTAGFGFVVEGVDGAEELSAQFAADVNDADPTGENVGMLASTDAFADALTAGPLAPQDGLLMLTAPDRLSPTLEQRLSAFDRITIIGGTAVVPQAIEDQIVAAGVKVDRVAGPNRFLTSVEVARRLRAGTTGTSIGLARADVAADTLAAAPQAFADASPILLTPTDALPVDYTREIIGSLVGCAGTTYVYGGVAAVTDVPVSQLAELRC